jgi:hypothetical protein
MVYFVDATSSPASFVITLAALTPVQGVTWTYTGLPTIPNSGVRFTTSDDTGITFTATPGFVNNLSNMTVRATLDDATTAAATFNISSGSGATLPAINPLAVIPFMNGLVGWYDGPSWDGTTINKFWRDKSGLVNNTSPSDVRGAITYDSTNGFLYGGVGDGLKFPALGTTANYTVIHLAKYNNGVKRRIFQGVTNDWASGFYAGKAGVAYHNGYITAPTDLYNYNWVISSDQRSLYRAHSIDFTAGTPGTPGYPDRIGLNFGAATTEYSDWAVAEVLIYNRVLTATEMLSVENYLRAKYPSLTIQIDTTTGASFTIPQANQTASVGTVNWTYKTPLPTGVSFSGSTQGGATFSIATGTYLNNQNLVVTASGNGGGGSRSIYLLSASRALLNAPNVAFNSGVAGSFTILQTASGTGGVTWAYSNLPSSVTFLSQSDAGLTFTVAQNAVVPTRTITVTATNGLGTPTVASFTYGSGVKPVLAIGTVSAIDSTTQQTFFVPQTVVDGLTGGITWSYSPAVFPTGLTVSATNQGATFTVAQNAVITPQTITVTATNVGGVATSISFTVGAAVKPVLTFSNQLLDTSTALKQFTITVQAPSVTYSGGITWSYVLPTGLTFVTSTSGLITFQAARSVVIASQTFAVTATNGVGTQTVASFTLGAGTPPTLSDPANGTGELILDTTSINRTFTIEQQSRNTGTIAWTITPSSYPTGVSIQSTTDFGVTFLLLQGSVLPYQPFTFRATATSGFTATRTFNVGGGTIVDLAGPGDPQLLDTTTQQTVQVAQRNDPAYTGAIVWTITPDTYPAGISITTQDDSKTIFTFNANSYLLRQQFVFTARAVSGLTSTVRFDIGAAVRPTLSTLTDRVLDTSTALKTFSVSQQVNTAYTGPITWIVTPNPFPAGSGMTQATTDGLITFTVPAQTSTTGVVWPNTPFSVTAKNTNTGYSCLVPSTFNVFAPRLPVVNAISTSIVDVSTTAYTVQASQSKTDAVPVVWTITLGSGGAVPSGVSINSSTGLITVAVGTYFAATVLKPIATNSAGAFGSTTFTLTTPAPAVINTAAPSDPQVLDVSTSPQTLTFTLDNSALAGTVAWSYTTTKLNVTMNSGTGVLTIAQLTYFIATSFTIKATNAAGVTTQRVISIAAPAIPTVTSATASPQTLEVTTTSRTIQFTQTTPNVGPVTWSYTPTTLNVAIDSNGLLTIDQGTYFAATDFTIKATNQVSKFGTTLMNVTTPAPPVINTSSPVSGQNVDVSTTARTFQFTNTASLTGTLTWSYTTQKTNVTINTSTGLLTVASGTYFTVTTFIIKVTNPVGIFDTRSFALTTPTPPVITGPTSTGTVVPGAGTGGVSRVYINNTAASKTVTITQTAANTGTITWSGITSLPTGVSLTPAPTDGLLIFSVATNAVLRPGGTGALARSNFATNPASKSSATISYDIFTPQTPVLGTPNPAPVGGTITLNTSTAQKTVTISQSVSAASTDPITWTTVPANLGTVTTSTSDTQFQLILATGVTVAPAQSITITAANRAGGVGGTASTAFTLFAPALPVLTTDSTGATIVAQPSPVYYNTLSGAKTITIYQKTYSADNGITWSTSALPSGVTYATTATTSSAVGGITLTIASGTKLTSGSDITVTATNGAGATASNTFKVYAGDPPSLTSPGDKVLDTTGSTDQTIVVSNSVAAPAPTWTDPAQLTGLAKVSAASTASAYTITVKQGAILAQASMTVTADSKIMPASGVAPSVTFKVTLDLLPVLTTPTAQTVDTTAGAGTFTVSQTSGGTVTGWSIRKVVSGVESVDSSVTITGTNTTGTVSIPKTTKQGPFNYIVRATNDVGTGATTAFSITAFYYVAPTVSFTRTAPAGPILVTTSINVATAAVTNPTQAGTCTFTVSPLPSGVSFSTDTLTYGAQALLGSTTYTVTATGTGGTGTATVTLNETYFKLPGLGPGLTWNPPYSGYYGYILVGRGGNGWSGSPGGGGGGGQVVDKTGIRFFINVGQAQPYIVARPNSTDLTTYGGISASYGGDAINRDGMYSFSVSTGLILYGGIGNTGIGGGGAGTSASGYAGSTSTIAAQTAGKGGAGYSTAYGSFGAGGGGGGPILTGFVGNDQPIAGRGGNYQVGGGGDGAYKGKNGDQGVIYAATAGADGTGNGGGGGASFSTAGAAGGSGAIIIVGKN